MYWQTPSPVQCYMHFSKESWVVVDGVLIKQNKLEIRVKIDWIFVSVLQS